MRGKRKNHFRAINRDGQFSTPVKKRAHHQDTALRPDRKFNEREFSRQSKKDHAIKTRLFAPTGRRIVA
jgi:hypothetical protein